MSKAPGTTYVEAQRRASEISALEVVGENEAARGWIKLAFEDAKSDAFAVWAKRGDRRLQPTTMQDIKMSDLYTWMCTRCKQQKRELDGLNTDLLSVEHIIASTALTSPIHRAIVRCQGVRLIERMLTVSEHIRQRLRTSKAGFRAAKDVAALDRALKLPGLPLTSATAPSCRACASAVTRLATAPATGTACASAWPARRKMSPRSTGP